MKLEENEKVVTIPVIWVSIVASVLLAVFTSWGMLAAAKATLETRATRNEKDIQALSNTKVDRDEFTLIIQRLDNIDKKLDARLTKEETK